MDPTAREGRVASAALGRLRTSGYALTTLAEIASAAGLSEAELSAAFGAKNEILAELAAPLLTRLNEVLDAACTADLLRPDQLRGVLESYHDALVEHRLLVEVILRDPTAGSSDAVVAVRAGLIRLRDELATGTGDDLDHHRVRAASALGAVQGAVLDLTDVDPTAVRDEAVTAAIAILLS
ncbi:MAG: TetR/AcrR family transcriptional regulator [Acidimicrobiales bacterium]